MPIENCRNVLVLLGLGDAENAVYELLQAMQGGTASADTEEQINRILRAKHLSINARTIIAMLRARGMLDVAAAPVYTKRPSRTDLQPVKPRVLKAEDLSIAG